MDTYEFGMAGRFREMLTTRAAELEDILRQETAGALDAGAPEVGDFKDAATEESLAAIDGAQAAHAARELEQVRAALRRLDDQSYGYCIDCGEAIDLRRLMAMPATPRCTGCQSRHEPARPH